MSREHAVETCTIERVANVLILGARRDENFASGMLTKLRDVISWCSEVEVVTRTRGGADDGARDDSEERRIALALMRALERRVAPHDDDDDVLARRLAAGAEAQLQALGAPPRPIY